MINKALVVVKAALAICLQALWTYSDNLADEVDQLLISIPSWVKKPNESQAGNLLFDGLKLTQTNSHFVREAWKLLEI